MNSTDPLSPKFYYFYLAQKQVSAENVGDIGDMFRIYIVEKVFCLFLVENLIENDVQQDRSNGNGLQGKAVGHYFNLCLMHG